MTDRDLGGVPIEQFIQALTSQLDRAQSALALKARAGLPLTFAVKDFSLDLRTHVDVSGSVVRIRPAGPGDGEASTLHLALTTITKPLIEENTVQFAAASDEPALKDAMGSELSDDELRRLEWAGVQTVAQLVDLERHSGSEAIERVVAVPALRLRAALEHASRPRITDVVAQPGGGDGIAPAGRTGDAPVGGAGPLLQIRGANLLRDRLPQVRSGGERVPVLQASPRELVVAPLPHQLAGTLEVETGPDQRATTTFALDGGAS